MRGVHVTVHVDEDVALDDHLSVGESGEASGWLYLGTSHDAALWGSPAGLRRLAAGLVLVAERAEGLRMLRYATTGNGTGLDGTAGSRGVLGS
jgi:hypothetical protein